MDKCFFGLSTSGHDPAFAVVNEAGQVVFAESTERFVQQKRAWGIDADHPEHIRHVLPHVLKGETDFVLSRSWLKSKANLHLDFSGGGIFDDHDIKWMLSLQDKAYNYAGINLKHYLKQPGLEPKSFDHHLCHAVNACASFSKDNGLCLVIDGEGEVGSVSIYRLKNRELTRLTRSWGPGSLGSFYGLLTKLCGFDWRQGEEWKVMGLAAFGNVQIGFYEKFKNLLSVKNGKLLFSQPDDHHQIVEFLAEAKHNVGNYMEMADIAASGQQAYTYFVNEILKHCEQYAENDLIISGGCALNSSFNGSLVQNSSYKNIHVPYAPADDGNAIGAALLAWMNFNETPKIPFIGTSPYLGTDIKWNTKAEISLKGLSFSKITDLGEKSPELLAQKLFEGKVIGVIRGRSEFGPRALGNRSILANPLGKHMKDHINNFIKGRESYRPFAPVVNEKHVDKYFQKSQPSPYMSFTLPWKTEMLDLVPAVVHQDGTGRLQTVNDESNHWFTELLHHFGELSGIPIILNTSFNVMGKPIVHSLDDALIVLMTTGLDAILYDNLLIEK